MERSFERIQPRLRKKNRPVDLRALQVHSVAGTETGAFAPLAEISARRPDSGNRHRYSGGALIEATYTKHRDAPLLQANPGIESCVSCYDFAKI